MFTDDPRVHLTYSSLKLVESYLCPKAFFLCSCLCQSGFVILNSNGNINALGTQCAPAAHNHKLWNKYVFNKYLIY